MSKTLWFVLLGGHVVWSLHLLVSYFLASAACTFVTDEWAVTRHAATLVAGAVTLAALAAGYRMMGAGPAEPRFVARVGMALSTMFLFAIAAAGVAGMALPPCV